MIPIIFPEGVVKSWCEALANPSLRHWSSLAIMLSDLWVQASIKQPGQPIVDDLRCLSDLAYQHMLDQMPQVEAESLPTLKAAA